MHRASAIIAALLPVVQAGWESNSRMGAQRSPWRPELMRYRGGGPAPWSLVKSPEQAYLSLAHKGQANAKLPLTKTIFQSVMAGCYIGFGGLLSLVVTAGSPGLKESNPGLHKFVFAALFPVNLLLILLTGGQLFTGNTAAVTAALCEGMVTPAELLRSWAASYVGNGVGCAAFAAMCAGAGFLRGPIAASSSSLALAKVGGSFGETVLKAIMCNWLVCMAVLLCGAAQDLTGKMVAIWFPISSFVAIGCEHSVANMFLLPLGLLAGARMTLADAVFKNLVPVSIGNAVAGAVIVGMGYSFAFGRLGGRCRL